MLKRLVRMRDYALCSLALGPTPGDKWSIFWKQTKNVRVQLRLDTHRPEDVFSLRTIYGPLYFRDNFGDITNLVDLFHRQVYGSGRLTEDGVILDVGANIGLTAAWLAFHNSERPIYCFEPLEDNTRLIRLNCPSAKIERVAVGADRTPVRLQVDANDVMASALPRARETRGSEFESVRLDDFATERGLERVALAKIDVEGMEIEVLEGCGELLDRTSRVVMETHSPALHAEAIGRLLAAGFRIASEAFADATGIVIAARSGDGS